MSHSGLSGMSFKLFLYYVSVPVHPAREHHELQLQRLKRGFHGPGVLLVSSGVVKDCDSVDFVYPTGMATVE